VNDAPPERWVLVFDGKDDGVPVAIRVRQLTKYALRSLNLRCREIREGAAAATTEEVLRLRRMCGELPEAT
jgi:hypothetical protein